MSFLNKISNIFAKNKDISKVLEFKVEFKEENILLTPNQDINKIENIIDLINIYNFVRDKLIEANIKKDIKVIEEVMPVIEDVRDMWHEIKRNYDMQK